MIGAAAMSTLSIKLPEPLYHRLRVMAEKRALMVFAQPA
jgi:hypothetical protein